MAATKAMLEKLTKESEEKKTRIKLQEEKIAKLVRKLEKRLAQSGNKDPQREEVEKSSFTMKLLMKDVHSKKRRKLKCDGSPGMMNYQVDSRLDCEHS